eukprot:gene9755-13124_t
MFDGLFGCDDDMPQLEVADVQTSLNHVKNIKVVRPSHPKAKVGFVGLENQGATCYLNALIQTMYMTPELRKGLFDINPIDLGINLVEDHQKEIEESTKHGIVEPDEKLLETLLSMGILENHAKKALIATKNAALDVVFDYIDRHENDPEFNQPIVIVDRKKKRKPRYIPLELQRLFAQLSMIDRLAISTQDLTTKGFEWQSLDGQVQHDAHELNRLLIEALEKSLKRTTGENLCQSLYEGKLANQIKCLKCNGISQREEPFYDLNMQIINCKDLVESLREYCCAELLEGDSAYQCDYCKAKTSALRSSILLKLPPILTFSCNRFKIDKSTNWQRVKVTTRNEFPLLINMDKYYFNNNNDVMNGVKLNPLELETNYLNSLRNDLIWVDKIYKRASQIANIFISNYGFDINNGWGSLTDSEYESIIRLLMNPMIINDENGQICVENNVWKYESNISNFSENNDYLTYGNCWYVLHSVIMHRGSAHSGHYFAYIRDNMNEGFWQHSPDSLTALLATDNNENEVVVCSPIEDETNQSNVFNDNKIDDKNDENNDNSLFVKVSNSNNNMVKYVINKESPLGIIITIIQNAKTRKSLGDNKHADSNQPTNNGASLKLISKEGTKLWNGKWNDIYQSTHGTLLNFINKYNQFFVNNSSNSFSLVDNIVLELLENNEFLQFKEKESNKHVQLNVKHETIKTENYNHRNVTDDVVDDDEAFARALQQSLNEEFESEKKPISNSPMKDLKENSAYDKQWEVAGKKKEKKQNKEILSTIKNPIKKKLLKNNKIQTTFSPNTSTNNSESNSNLTSNSNDNIDSSAQEKNFTKSSTSTEKKVEKSNIDHRVDYLVNELVNHIYGTFFEFNDSIVKPMTIKDLEKAYSGLDSAYLLVYRQFNLDDYINQLLHNKNLHKNINNDHMKANNEDNLKDKSSVSSKVSHAPIPPTYWIEKIEEMNQNLVNERVLYDTLSNKITIYIAYPALVEYETPLLYQKNALLPQTVQENTDFTCPLILEIDSRVPISTILSNFIVLFTSEELQKMGLDFLSHSENNNEKRFENIIMINKLDKYGDGFHISHPCAHSDSIDDHLGNYSVVLLWDGIHLPLKNNDNNNNKDHIITKVSKIIYGYEAIPKSITVKLLDLNKSDPKKPKAEVISTIQVWVPYCMNLSELCYFISNKCNINYTRSVIHLIDQGVTNNTNHSNNKTKLSNQNLKEISFVSTLLYEKSLVSYKTINKVNRFPHTNTSFDVTNNVLLPLITDQTMIGELDCNKFKELVVEDCESKGFLSTHLADSYCTLKNSEWIISVELDFMFDLNDDKVNEKVVSNGMNVSIIENEKKGSDELVAVNVTPLTDETAVDSNNSLLNSVNTFNVQIEMQKNDSVYDLKVAALKKFRLNVEDFWSMTKLRCDSDKAVGLLEDESLSLVDAKLKNGIRLFLEKSNKPTFSSSITLTVILVQGNNTHVKYDINKSGNRIKEIELVVDINDTIQSIRDKIGCDLMNYPSNWTQLSLVDMQGLCNDSNDNSANNVYVGHRLRRTNWLKEAMDIIYEGDIANQLFETISSQSLRHGDTVLFEDGVLPVKGQVSIEIFIWNNNPNNNNEETNPILIKNGNIDQLGSIGVESNAMDVTTYHYKKKQKFLIPLKLLTMQDDNTVMELYEKVYEALLEKNEELQQIMMGWKTPETIDHFLISELRPDLLPGRCLWTCPPPASSSSIQDITASIGKKSPVVIGNNTNNSNNNNGVSSRNNIVSTSMLKKLNIKNSEKSLVIEVLSDVQKKVRPGTVGAFRIWVQRLLNPGQADEGNAIMSPAWPPHQILVNGGISPSIAHLKRPINSKIFDDKITSLDKLIIYRYMPNSMRWVQIKSQRNSNKISDNKKRSNASTKKADIITGPPHNVKEGDLMCVFNVDEVITSNANEGNGVSIIGDGKDDDDKSEIMIILPEDVEPIRLRAEELKNREFRKLNRHLRWDDNNMLIDNVDGKSRFREVNLSLGKNYDFSDEDDF